MFFWKLVWTRTQEKGAVTPQEPGPDSSVSVQESLAWVDGGLLQGATECGSDAWELFKKVTIIFNTSSIVWHQVTQQGGTTAPSPHPPTPCPAPINSKLD